jgi:hypothetical protein
MLRFDRVIELFCPEDFEGWLGKRGRIWGAFLAAPTSPADVACISQIGQLTKAAHLDMVSVRCLSSYLLSLRVTEDISASLLRSRGILHIISFFLSIRWKTRRSS